ncbi:MAG: SLC13 family permease [Acidobacteriota bacterium]|nr:SLC13 family permease [Acidobacteriota bacterium]
MLITFLILLATLVFFVINVVRSDIVALCALLLLMLFGILTPAEALSGFSSSILIMMIGLFVVGGAIFQTGLAKNISSRILRLAGDSQTRLFVLVILGTALMGGFISNTGIIAIMMPIVVSMASVSGISPSRLLMPLAFAGSLSGTLTLIGTPPNLIVHETLVAAGHKGLSFFSFLPVGAICVTMGIILLLPLSKLLIKKDEKKEKDKHGKSLSDLTAEYQIAKNLYRLKVTQNSPAADKKLRELAMPAKYGAHLFEIRRRAAAPGLFSNTVVEQILAEAETVILAGDTLYISGNFANIQRFADDYGLELTDTIQAEEETPIFAGKLRFDSIGIAEVILMSTSNLVNLKVSESGFYEKYKVNILGINRRKNYILQNLRDEKMQPGDVLLVQGKWQNIERLSEDSSDLVVVGQPLREAPKTKRGKEATAALIMLLMVTAMALEVVPSVTAALVAAILMVLTGCFRNAEDAYNSINWQSVVLIGSMLPVGTALEKTGTISLVTQGLVDGLGGYGPHALLIGIYFCTSLMTLFISNTATAVLFAPIGLHAATAVGVSPIPFMFAVAVAASMCFAVPFSTPPNALVMSAGRYTFMDYVKVGLPMQIIFGIVMVAVLPLLFPFK